MTKIRNRHMFAISLTLVVMLVFAYAVAFNFTTGNALAEETPVTEEQPPAVVDRSIEIVPDEPPTTNEACYAISAQETRTYGWNLTKVADDNSTLLIRQGETKSASFTITASRVTSAITEDCSAIFQYPETLGPLHDMDIKIWANSSNQTDPVYASDWMKYQKNVAYPFTFDGVEGATYTYSFQLRCPKADAPGGYFEATPQGPYAFTPAPAPSDQVANATLTDNIYWCPTGITTSIYDINDPTIVPDVDGRLCWDIDSASAPVVKHVAVTIKNEYSCSVDLMTVGNEATLWYGKEDKLEAQAEVPIQIPEAAVTITKQGTPKPVTRGGAIDYKIVVTNTGGIVLEDVYVDDVFNNGKTDRYVLPIPLKPGDIYEITFSYTTIAGDPSPLNNTATVVGYYYYPKSGPSIGISNDSTSTELIVRKRPYVTASANESVPIIEPYNPPYNPPDGPSQDYGGGGQETVSVPSENVVNTPAPPQEALQVPVETPVAAPLAPIAPKGELPFTGGDPFAFAAAGMSVLGLAALIRRRFS
ncbi:MAG: hypothetical protein ACM3UZ_00570 [Acidobacteriota bacterium]